MEENKKELAFDMNRLIIRVHNKIAIWNNTECSVEEKTIALKALSHDIVSDIITTAFSELKEVKTKERVLPGEPAEGE